MFCCRNVTLTGKGQILARCGAVGLAPLPRLMTYYTQWSDRSATWKLSNHCPLGRAGGHD
jgi:hypothetical protein